MANQTITQLPDAGPITGTELVPIVQNGGTYKTTTAAISASPSQNQTFLTKNQELTLPNSRYLSTGTGLGLTDGGATSFYRISLNGASGSLEAAGAGLIVKNSSTTVVARTLETSGSGISVSNGDGTGANPTFQLTGLAAAIANMGGTGMLAVVGGATIAGRQITGTANQIGVTSGNGSGNPTISIADNAVLPGTGAVTIPVGTNAQQPLGAEGQLRFNSETQTFDGYASGSWSQFSLVGGVTSISGGTTGLTPSSPTGGAVVLGGTLNVSNGGTGATSLTGYIKGSGTSAMTASASIPNTDISGLGTMSTQNANNVAVTGGSIAGATITGGTINNTPIGAGTAAAGTFTNVAMTTGTITTAPVNSTDIVNKQYADAIASGIHFHEAVNLATTAALPANTYNNGTSGVGATLTGNANGALSIDSTLTTATERVLVKNEAAGANNGVYVVTQVGSAGAPYILTRSTDMDSVGTGVDQIDEGDFFLVTSGTANVNTAWVQQTPPPITIGTTALVFQQFSAPITYTAGTGLNESPAYTFNIANTGVAAATYGSVSQVPVFAVNAQGQITSVTNTSIAIAAGAVSGLAASATTDTTNASNITSGTLGTGRISGSYTGITAVGTLTSGTWNAAAIGVAYGGTGLTATPTNGQLAIGNGSGYSLATLTAGTNVSISNSAGGITINATPSFGGTVTSVDGSGGTTGLTLSGGPITVSGTLTLGGTLIPANGGTGATTLTGYVFGNGTSTMTASTTIPNTAITGLGTMSTQAASNVAITGGAIDGATVGATTASTVRGTTITATTQFTGPGTGLTGTASSLSIGGNAGTITSQANSATITASSTNTANEIVLRDSSGNFSAGTITATLSGNATNVSGTVAVANGGTGSTSLTANNVLLGNGTSALQVVAPGTAGNVLASDGTTWVSQAAPASTSIAQLDTSVTVTDGVTSFTASVASSATTIQASQSGTTLTVTVVNGAAPIVVGATISGINFLPNTVVTAFGTGTGGTGTYTVSTSHGRSSTAANLVYSTMTVTAVASGTLAIGQRITNAPSSAATLQTIPLNTSIVALGTGTGGTGTYILDKVFTLNSSTVFAGGSVATVVDGQNVKTTAGGNMLIRTTPQFNDSQGSFLSNRLMGLYATRTAGSGVAYYADLNGNGVISGADGTEVARIQLNLNQGNPRILSYACAYGTNGQNVGLGFSAFSLADIGQIGTGLSPSQIPGAINTVAVGHLSQVGARITFNKYGLDPLNSGNVRNNTTTYVAAEHQFLGGPVSLGGVTTITSAGAISTAMASTWTYVIFNAGSTATVTLQTQNAVIDGRIDDGTNTASGTTLTVNSVTGQAIFVGMEIFVPGLATEYVTVTAFGTGTGGAGTYTVGTSARVISTQMISSGPTAGRMLSIKTIQNSAVNSAASNVIPLAGGAAGTAILAAAAGRWATLVFNGTNWEIMAAN
jgi:hypothetical protein